jgi:Uma2 family endonuclease
VAGQGLALEYGEKTMSALAKRRYTLEEYLELDRHGTERYEYFDGEVVAMSGASLQHNRIVRNLMRAIDARLEGKPCEVLPADMRIRVPRALPYRYADLVVVCGEPIIEDLQGVEMLVNPLVIIEVLSASTEAYDRGIKFFEYQSIASLQEYVLIAQDRPHITHYARQEGGQWLRSDLQGVAERLLLPRLDCTIPVAEIYRQVPLSRHNEP